MALPERVWLLRHAETTAPHVLNGAESDVPLSEHGFRQAEALGGWFVPFKPTAVVSSTMIRAVQTAAPIARECGAPHTREHLLRERMIGALSGQPFHLGEGPWAETVRAWMGGDTAHTTEGAESFDDLRETPCQLGGLHSGTRRVVQPAEHIGGSHAAGRLTGAERT